MISVRDRFVAFIRDLQDRICAEVAAIDGGSFRSDPWEREGGGGGDTRILNGEVIEKGGVNTSVVYGRVTDPMREQLKISGHEWFAAGLSLVLHPVNPYAPTVHANWRYFELYDAAGAVTDSWFGGGTDLTPYYLFEDDARHFHRTLKETLDPFGAQFYPKFKAQCDGYFVNRHRENEARGIGGIFYDYLRPDADHDNEWLLRFQQANGDAFLSAYMPVLRRRKDEVYGEREKNWQEIRRGRYVEFNLIHDRGTLFGLRTNGRTESILMSLPPRARWEYDYQPQPGSPEAELQEALKPRDWIN